jgi:N-acetylmuramoyl-L-alanine amidase
MKRALWLVVVMVLGFSPVAPAASSPAPRVHTVLLMGRPYVLVTDWARANGFSAAWLKKDDTLRLSGGASRIVLRVDDCDAQVNGVNLRLLYAVYAHAGGIYLSYIDAQTTLRPLLYPPRNKPQSRIQTIVLDPGHGGDEPGYHVGSRNEKTYTLLLAQELQQQLVRAGFRVSLTRTRDAYVDLPTRPLIAQKRNADLFISLHFNAAISSVATVRGIEVYCMTPAGAPSSNAQGAGAGTGSYPGNANNDKNAYLAYQLQKTLVRDLQTEDRGMRRARFWVLRDAVMPAVLIESGYMSHPDEGRKIFDAAYRRQLAKSIVQGVLAYKRTVERAG